MAARNTNVDAESLQRLMPGAPAAAIAELAASARQVTYEAGDTVVPDGGHIVPGLVAAGRLRLTVRAADGREAALRTVCTGAMFGLVPLFEAEYSMFRAERGIVALDRSVVYLFDAQTLLRVSRQHAAVACHLARSLADFAGVLGDVAAQFAFMTVRQRLAAHLLTATRTDPAGREVALVTQQELANAIGSVREVVARTLHDLRANGVVRVSPGRIEVLNDGGLTEIARGVS